MALYLGKFSCLRFSFEARFDLCKLCLSHRAIQGVAQQCSFIDDRFPFQIPFTRIAEGLANNSFVWFCRVLVASSPRRVDNASWLTTEFGGQGFVSFPHFFMRNLKFLFASLVCGDLGSSRPSLVIPGQMFFNLSASWTRCFQVFGTVSLYFWLATLSAFYGVTQLLEPSCKF